MSNNNTYIVNLGQTVNVSLYISFNLIINIESSTNNNSNTTNNNTNTTSNNTNNSQKQSNINVPPNFLPPSTKINSEPTQLLSDILQRGHF